DLQLTTSDGTSKISFVNSSGVEVASITSSGDAYFHSITSPANEIGYRITADTIATTITTLIDTGMSFNIGANEHWSFEYNLANTWSAGAGMTFGIGTSVAPTHLRAVVVGAAGSQSALTSDVIVATGTPTTSAFNSFNNTVTLLGGFVRITGDINAGNAATTV